MYKILFHINVSIYMHDNFSYIFILLHYSIVFDILKGRKLSQYYFEIASQRILDTKIHLNDSNILRFSQNFTTIFKFQ